MEGTADSGARMTLAGCAAVLIAFLVAALILVVRQNAELTCALDRLQDSAGAFAVRLNPSILDEGGFPMDPNVTLHLGQKKRIVLSPTGPDGAAAALANVPTYVSSDPSVLDVTVIGEDGLAADLTLIKTGNATVAIHAEGDPEAGVDPLDQNVVCTVAQEEASSLNAKVVDSPA